MKKLLLLLVLLISLSVRAEEKCDSTLIRVGKQNVVVIQDSTTTCVKVYGSDGKAWVKTREVTFNNGQEVEQVFVLSPFFPVKKNRYNKIFTPHFPDFYYGANLLCAGNEVEMRDTKSSEWGFSPFQMGLSLSRYNSLGLVSAMQFGFVHNHFDTHYYIDKVNNKTCMQPLNEKDVTTSFLKYYYIKIPMMFEYQKSKGGRKIFAGVGASLEYRYKERSKYRIDSHKHTLSKDIGINVLGINAEAYVGYSNINLYIHYATTPLFKNGISSMPLGVGIGVNL